MPCRLGGANAGHKSAAAAARDPAGQVAAVATPLPAESALAVVVPLVPAALAVVSFSS